MYRNDDACIVGYGSLFAGTWNSKEFIDGVFAGKCYISDLREQPIQSFPWEARSVYNPDRRAEDQSYSPHGAYIDRRRLSEVAAKQGSKWETFTSLEVALLEAAAEAIYPVRDLPGFDRAHVIIGQSTIDTEVYLALTDEVAVEIVENLKAKGFPAAGIARVRAQLDSCIKKWPLRKPQLSYTIATTAVQRIRERFGLRGPSCLIDAACASSFAAFHLGMKRLRSREADFVVTGGVDVSVTPGSLVFFSRLGAMSPEICVPFDQKAGGLNQGEGAGVFVLMRLSDALDRGLKIHGVIRACEGSSDGASSSIVEPTAEGQRLAYQRTYSDAGVTEVDYIEAHGTGTVVGDRTEIQSLTEQFPGRKIPIGSVKSTVGHTIGAAGASSLLKAIGVLERRAAPPSPYFTRYPKGFKTDLFLTTTPIPLRAVDRPLTVASSSFGFGGSNFHLVVQEYTASESILDGAARPQSPVVICGEAYFALDELEELAKNSQRRLPPKVVPWLDRLHRLGVYATEETLRRLGIAPDLLDRDRVSVISSSMTPLDNYWGAGRRVMATVLKRQMAEIWTTEPESDDTVEQCIDAAIQRDSRITEDTLSGFLNNLIAGRICNAFDFRGISFNLDCDLASPAAALGAAKTLLSQSHGMTIVVSASEEFGTTDVLTRRKGMWCRIVASAAYALEHDLPIAAVLKDVTYEEKSDV